MKFLVVRTVDGFEKFNVVEADTPMDAMKEDDHIGFLGAVTGESNERSEEIANHDVGTVGIYEIGQVNHLEAIVDLANKALWAHKRIDELESN